MYVPRAFAMDPQRLERFLSEPRRAHLVTSSAQGPDATLLPVMFRPDDGPRGSFVAHMSRVNQQWKSRPLGEAMLILTGPDAHIPAKWTPEAYEARAAVPTWNYLEVHAFGDLIVHDDPGWTRAVANELAVTLEPDYDIDALAEPFGSAVIRAIVGIEVLVTRIVAKAKLSQNKSLADVESVVTALREDGFIELADETAALSCPYVTERDQLVAEAAARGPHHGG